MCSPSVHLFWCVLFWHLFQVLPQTNQMKTKVFDGSDIQYFCAREGWIKDREYQQGQYEVVDGQKVS